MATITIDCGSFDLTSHNGNTAYSGLKYFDIPANAGITSCVATFSLQVNTGNFQGKSFSLNGTQAHPNTPWPTSGISLNAALLSTGQNVFRAAVKSQTGLSARWGISSITLTITYTDVGGGGEDPPPQPPYIGGLAVSPTSITAGASLYIATGACDGGLIRHISIYRADTNAFVASVVASHGVQLGEWMFPIPVGWCEFAPNGTYFQLRIELYAHYPDGGFGGVENRTVGVTIPDDIKPTIGSFTAAYNANGVNGAITKYVQNYSKVNLAMGGVSGTYGSSIVSYEITGGGLSAWSSSATLGPLAQSGSITFTAKVVDSRGRVGTKTVAINVEPYSSVSVNNLQAYRSDASKNPADEGAFATLIGKLVFSSIGGQNAGTIKGRVYEKGTTAPGWTTMADNTLVLFGGSLSVEKAYTAEISINDLITSYLYSVDIPTGTVIMGVAPDGDGVSFGRYPEAGKVVSAWPIVAPNFYPIGAIYMSLTGTSPATLFGGTWAAIDAGRFLVAAGTGYPAGDTGGQSSFSLTGENLPNIAFDVLMQGSGSNTWGLPAPTSGGTAGWVPGYVRSGGSGNAISIIPPWYAVYMWRRTA